MAVTPLNSTGLNDFDQRVKNAVPGFVQKTWVDGRAAIFDVVAYGAVGDDTANDTTPIVNAIAAASGAGGGTVFFPSGTYKITASVTIPDGVSLLGWNPHTTTLHWPTDLTGTPGAAVYGLTQSSASWPAIIRGLNLKGPGTSSVHGVVPANMSGVKMCAGGWMDECFWSGWWGGVWNTENHEVVTNSRCGSNWYGIYRKKVGTSGNQYFANLGLDNNNFASFGLDGNSAYDGVLFNNLHLANSPYMFYGEADLGAQLLDGCELNSVAFEGYNNGIIYAPGLRGVNDVKFYNCSEASGFSSPLAGNPADYAIDAYNVSVLIDNGFISAVGAKGVISARGALSGWWQDFTNAYNNAEAASKPVFVTGDTSLGFYGRSGAIEFRVAQPNTNSGTIVKNDLVASRFDEAVQRNSGAGANGIPIGVALQPDRSGTYAGAVVPVAVRGRVSIRTAALATGSPQYVKPDTVNAGEVVAATGVTDSAIGIQTSNASAGLVSVRLQGLA